MFPSCKKKWRIKKQLAFIFSFSCEYEISQPCHTYRNRLCAWVLYGISSSVSLWCSTCSCLPSFVTHLNMEGILWGPSIEFLSKTPLLLKGCVGTAKLFMIFYEPFGIFLLPLKPGRSRTFQEQCHTVRLHQPKTRDISKPLLPQP